MTSFLFWNLQRKPLQSVVAQLAMSNEVDVIMLAECTVRPNILLYALNANGALYDYAPSNCTKIEVFTKFPGNFISAVYDENRWTIRRLALPGIVDILLVVVHLLSKWNWNPASQTAECSELVDIIREEEQRVGHARTVLVGDMNMSPFEAGIVNANGLHGTMSRRIAKKRTRTIQQREYPFFYNPMWNFLGDAGPNPPGTFYYQSAEHNALFWHMFDQVLIRPDLLDRFNNTDLRIITTDGATSFLSNSGTPDKNIASDHLPIFFKINL